MQYLTVSAKPGTVASAIPGAFCGIEMHNAAQVRAFCGERMKVAIVVTVYSHFMDSLSNDRTLTALYFIGRLYFTWP